MTDEVFERFPTARSAPAGRRYGPHEVFWRRTGIVLLLAAVVAGCLGWLGPASGTASAGSPAGVVEVEYHKLTRPGVNSEVLVSVRPERPTDTIVLAIDRIALETYGVDGFAPEPVEQSVEGSVVLLEFAVGDAPELELSISGRTPTTQPPGRTHWELRWSTEGAPEASVALTTWVLP